MAKIKYEYRNPNTYIQYDVNYSIWNKKLTIKIDEKKYDISHMVSENIWNIGGGNFPTDPSDDWMIRKELRKIIIKFFKENIDKDVNVKDMVFL